MLTKPARFVKPVKLSGHSPVLRQVASSCREATLECAGSTALLHGFTARHESGVEPPHSKMQNISLTAVQSQKTLRKRPL